MEDAAAWKPVIEQYPSQFRPDRVEFLGGAGGFSGATFWRLRTPSDDFCLRRWPAEHPSNERLKRIHAVLQHVAGRGIDFVPLPVASVSGTSFLHHQGRFWELTPWLPGQAEKGPLADDRKLQAALAALARFHLAAEDFPLPDCGLRRSPAIGSRLEQTHWWCSGGLRQLTIRLDAVEPSPLSPLGREVVEVFRQIAPKVERTLAAVVRIETPLQPVIRDIWSDHVLFTGDRVSGFVDFGSLDIDSPATDVARLLGSMAGDEPGRWEVGLAAYESVRQLQPAERSLLGALDQSAVLLSGMNWLKWVYLEDRYFENQAAVVQRLKVTLARMRHLKETTFA